jgi:hypothetical protein
MAEELLRWIKEVRADIDFHLNTIGSLSARVDEQAAELRRLRYGPYEPDLDEQMDHRHRVE